MAQSEARKKKDEEEITFRKRGEKRPLPHQLRRSEGWEPVVAPAAPVIEEVPAPKEEKPVVEIKAEEPTPVTPPPPPPAAEPEKTKTKRPVLKGPVLFIN